MTAARTAAVPCWTNTRQKIRELSPCIRKMPAFRRHAMRECAWPEGNTSLLWTAMTGWKERRMRIYCRSCKAGGRILSFFRIWALKAGWRARIFAMKRWHRKIRRLKNWLCGMARRWRQNCLKGCLSERRAYRLHKASSLEKIRFSVPKVLPEQNP